MLVAKAARRESRNIAQARIGKVASNLKPQAAFRLASGLICSSGMFAARLCFDQGGEHESRFLDSGERKMGRVAPLSDNSVNVAGSV